jgi:ribosomal-protein-alanine N-acetyltransferase
VIRAATAADADRLAQLHGEAFAEPWSAAALAAVMASRGVEALAAEDGFIVIRTVAGEAEILTLAVAPPARRRGLGRALVDAAADIAARAGAEAMFLEVAADNTAALALYASAGFVPVGRRAGYYRRAGSPAMDALVLRRPLVANA